MVCLKIATSVALQIYPWYMNMQKNRHYHRVIASNEEISAKKITFKNIFKGRRKKVVDLIIWLKVIVLIFFLFLLYMIKLLFCIFYVYNTYFCENFPF